jgi:cytochrome P450
MRVTLEIVGKTLFDAELGEEANEIGEALTVAMDQMMRMLTSIVPWPPFVPTPGNLRQKKAVGRLDETVYRMIRARRSQLEEGSGDRGDVLSMLLAAQDEDGTRMNDRQVRDEAMTLFLAGHETTANGLAWSLHLLAKHPEIRARAEREIDAVCKGMTPTLADLKQLPFILQIFKEAMRLYPPAYIMGRRAYRDVEIGPYSIPKGQLVFLNIAGIHRKPDLFPSPDAFDPDRFANDAEKSWPKHAYMPFGAGPRICIGNHFALMEAQIVLATLLQRVRLDMISQAPVRTETLVTLRPKGGLPMRAAPRA